MKSIDAVLNQYSGEYTIRQAKDGDVDGMVKFFAEQPEPSFEFFTPHAFDAKTIKKLIRRKSHLSFLILDGDKIIGYYFLRCFFIGKSFLGKMVDYRYRGRGVGKTMCMSAMDVAMALGLRMYETISKDNLASLYSTQKVLDVTIIEEMDNGYFYIEDRKKK
ncbi:MAG: GNAT family N-acetyltransferase [Bacteroidaceae bacterium]|nr:GNAT family N-acetyltransferase [Bacteroidaceae bacterium]